MKSLYVTLVCVFLYAFSSAQNLADITPIANLGSGEIVISWNQTSDLVRYYELEKLNDENEWMGVKMTRPNDTGEFEISDFRMTEGLNSYRIKIKSNKGDFFYSSTTEIYYEPIVFEVLIYPNPANNRIVIDSGNLKAMFTTKLIDRYGNEVLAARSDEGRSTMNTSQVLEGMYFLKVEGHGKSFKKAIVINHR